MVGRTYERFRIYKVRARTILLVKPEVFIELVKSIEYSLIKLGIIKKMVIQNLDNHHGDFDLTFIIKALKPFDPNSIKHGKIILVQTEQLLNMVDHHLSNCYDRVLEMFYRNTKFDRGTENVVFCPIGYSPVWEFDLKPAEKDIDVLFWGVGTPRRKKFIKELQGLGIHVVYKPSQDLFGKQRAEFINRSKIVLYIHPGQETERYHSPLHTLPAQANKAFCLVEESRDFGLFKKGINFHTFNGVDECKKMVMKWLNNPAREKFAKRAYDDLITSCDFTKILNKAMEDL